MLVWHVPDPVNQSELPLPLLQTNDPAGFTIVDVMAWGALGHAAAFYILVRACLCCAMSVVPLCLAFAVQALLSWAVGARTHNVSASLHSWARLLPAPHCLQATSSLGIDRNPF